MSCFTTNITHISAGLVYKRCAFSKRFNTMAEPGTLIFRNNTCVKKVKEKIISKKALRNLQNADKSSRPQKHVSETLYVNLEFEYKR